MKAKRRKRSLCIECADAGRVTLRWNWRYITCTVTLWGYLLILHPLDSVYCNRRYSAAETGIFALPWLHQRQTAHNKSSRHKCIYPPLHPFPDTPQMLLNQLSNKNCTPGLGLLWKLLSSAGNTLIRTSRGALPLQDAGYNTDSLPHPQRDPRIRQ